MFKYILLSEMLKLNTLKCHTFSQFKQEYLKTLDEFHIYEP